MKSLNPTGLTSFRDTMHAGLWLIRLGNQRSGAVTVKLAHGRVWEIPADVTAGDIIRTPWVWGN
jgi:hypothetical protein